MTSLYQKQREIIVRTIRQIEILGGVFLFGVFAVVFAGLLSGIFFMLAITVLLLFLSAWVVAVFKSEPARFGSNSSISSRDPDA